MKLLLANKNMPEPLSERICSHAEWRTFISPPPATVASAALRLLVTVHAAASLHCKINRD